jgi:hypothetical protein
MKRYYAYYEGREIVFLQTEAILYVCMEGKEARLFL